VNSNALYLIATGKRMILKHVERGFHLRQIKVNDLSKQNWKKRLRYKFEDLFNYDVLKLDLSSILTP